MTFDVVTAALDTGTLLDRLGIAYVLGGGLASSLYGEPRTTVDVDVAARIPSEQVDRFVSLATPDFFVDREALVEAIQRRVLFQLVHRKTLVKIDIHVVSDDPLQTSQLERARWRRLSADSDDEIRVASPEDVVIQKLIWFAKSDRKSERQWRDVKGILKLRGTSMDIGYLQRWSEHAGVRDLPVDALKECGLRGSSGPGRNDGDERITG